ncbi:MAG: hypothetical protein ACOZQL_38180 [Myxococcota bacterium]
MLAALLASFVLAAPDADTRSDLFVHVSAQGGASLFDVDASLAGGGARGPVAGVRVGLRASRPPFVSGGGRLGLLPSLELHHDFGSGRTEWLGAAALTVTVWKLFLLTRLGYGLSVQGPEPLPRHLLSMSAGLAVKLGAVWLELDVRSVMRFRPEGRTLQVLTSVGWEFDLPE